MELRGHLSSSSRPAGKAVYAEAGQLAGDTSYMALRAGRGLGTLFQQDSPWVAQESDTTERLKN